MGVVVIKALADELSVLVVGRKDHLLAEAIIAGISSALGHQHLQALVHGLGIEQPGVDRTGINPASVLHVLFLVEQLPLGLLVLTEVGVADALARETQRHGAGPEGPKKAVSDGLIEAVLIGGQADLPIEEFIGVAVDLLARRVGEAAEQRIEVGEDGAIFLVDAAMGLVDDHQIEVPHPEALHTVGVLRIDEVHHRGVVGEEHPTLTAFVGHQVHR